MKPTITPQTIDFINTDFADLALRVTGIILVILGIVVLGFSLIK